MKIELPQDLPTAHSVITTLTSKNAELEQQLAWFRRQIFGRKSEKIVRQESRYQQLHLGEQFIVSGPPTPPPSTTVKEHARSATNKVVTSREDERGLRFDQNVPVEEITLPVPEIEGLSPGEYEVVRTEVTHVLAQRPGQYYVKRYTRPVVKVKGSFCPPPVVPLVLERSFADVTLLAGILIDKFIYHLPLYRIHQRLLACGITISRATLTNYVHRACELLRPIADALVRSILSSKVLLMDETPVRAGRDKPGKMKRGYFWVIYGDEDEISFLYFDTRASAVITQVLGEAFTGTLVTDQYPAYQRYTSTVLGVQHALCWSHMRREFFEALVDEPAASDIALSEISNLYDIEARIRDASAEKRQEVRGEESLVVIDRFFGWLRDEQKKNALLPSNKFQKAATYALHHEDKYRLFLSNPDIPLDTNTLERGIRPNAIGRKNWLFCWTEVGAEYVGVIQSLLGSCRLQHVDPFRYLCDVLTRIDTHQMTDIDQLTPRRWKVLFGDASTSHSDHTA